MNNDFNNHHAHHGPHGPHGHGGGRHGAPPPPPHHAHGHAHGKGGGKGYGKGAHAHGGKGFHGPPHGGMGGGGKGMRGMRGMRGCAPPPPERVAAKLERLSLRGERIQQELAALRDHDTGKTNNNENYSPASVKLQNDLTLKEQGVHMGQTVLVRSSSRYYHAKGPC